VDSDDLAVWKAHFGNMLPPPGPGSAEVNAVSTSPPADGPQQAVSAPLATHGVSAVEIESVPPLGPERAEPRVAPAASLFAERMPNTAPRRTQRILATGRSILPELSFDELLISSEARSIDKSSDSVSSPLRQARGHEQSAHAGALDHVFTHLGCNFWRRRACEVKRA
jgi:hypothetical protein